MQIYELGYLVLPSVAEEGLLGVVNSLKGIIAKEGGQELDGESPIKQELAYTMSKTVGASRYVVNDAYLGWLKFEVEADKIEGIKSRVEKMDEILRLLLIKAPRETGFTFAEALRKQEEALEPAVSAEEISEVKEVVVE